MPEQLYKKLSAPARSLDLRIPALEALAKMYTEGTKKREALETYASLYAIDAGGTTASALWSCSLSRGL